MTAKAASAKTVNTMITRRDGLALGSRGTPGRSRAADADGATWNHAPGSSRSRRTTMHGEVAATSRATSAPRILGSSWDGAVAASRRPADTRLHLKTVLDAIRRRTTCWWNGLITRCWTRGETESLVRKRRRFLGGELVPPARPESGWGYSAQRKGSACVRTRAGARETTANRAETMVT